MLIPLDLESILYREVKKFSHWCEENEMVFVSHEGTFPATSDHKSRVAGNGTECKVKTIELSSPTSGGEH